MSVSSSPSSNTGEPIHRFDRPVVLGAGPVGSAIVRSLAQRGHQPVVVTRSGRSVVGAEARTADLADREAARTALADATIVFSAAQPEYHRWAEEFPGLQASIVEACSAAGAPLMVVENMYAYGPPTGALNESTPISPSTKKGRVRAQMWSELEQAHADERIEMAVVRASDFIGPGVEGSAFGTRFFDPLRKGKPARTVGDPDALHSVTFIPDLGEAMVRVAEDDKTWGRAWHAPCAPPVSQRELAELAAAAVGHAGKISTAPVWLLRALGLFIPAVRETIEMIYEFDDDFVVDSTAFTHHFGMKATPLDEAVGMVMRAQPGPVGSR